MSRLINSFEQFFDSNGEPLASGLLDFFESGSSSVRKTTYADSGETIPNSNPVVLNGDGRAPNIFGTGTYNVILRTAGGSQIVARDPVGGDLQLTFGADWSAFQTYSITDVVRDDAQYWQSLVSGNLGNQPSLDDGSRWQLFLQGEIDNADILATTVTRKTSSTGSSILPVGTEAQRDVTPLSGYLRFNTTLNKFEGYDGTQWGTVGGGAGGGGADEIFYLNDTIVTQNYTIPVGKNAGTFGPITIADGVTVTVSDGSTWSIV